MATITRRPTGDVTAVETFLHLTANDVTENDTDGTPINYYMKLTASGEDDLKSVIFSGDFTWDNVLIPAAGTWTASLCQQSDDSVVTTLEIIAA